MDLIGSLMNHENCALCKEPPLLKVLYHQTWYYVNTAPEYKGGKGGGQVLSPPQCT